MIKADEDEEEADDFTVTDAQPKEQMDAVRCSGMRRLKGGLLEPPAHPALCVCAPRVHVQQALAQDLPAEGDDADGEQGVLMRKIMAKKAQERGDGEEANAPTTGQRRLEREQAEREVSGPAERPLVTLMSLLALAWSSF